MSRLGLEGLRLVGAPMGPIGDWFPNGARTHLASWAPMGPSATLISYVGRGALHMPIFYHERDIHVGTYHNM